jgi:hypothetical protein
LLRIGIVESLAAVKAIGLKSVEIDEGIRKEADGTQCTLLPVPSEVNS